MPKITDKQRASVKARLQNAVDLLYIAMEEMMVEELETTAIASESMKTATDILAKDIKFLDSRN